MSESDPVFERYLKGDTPQLQHLSRLDEAQPPADLDHIVLDRARRAIAAPRRRYLRPQWTYPLACAATLLLAFSVSLYMGVPRFARPLVAPSAGRVNGNTSPSARAPAPPAAQPQGGNSVEQARAQQSTALRERADFTPPPAVLTDRPARAPGALGATAASKSSPARELPATASTADAAAPAANAQAERTSIDELAKKAAAPRL
ncbi:MAG TPA: hypothetical protein VF315_04845, partial [Steroidobacteraceae bacterium]